VVAWKDGRRFVFQCKRVQAFTAAHARKEIKKLRELPADEQPQELVFVVTRAVSAEARSAIRVEWGNEETCHFWAGSELDERVKRHPEIVTEFFQLPSVRRQTDLRLISRGREAAVLRDQSHSTGHPSSRRLVGSLDGPSGT
jgi:hypothetical protein